MTDDIPPWERQPGEPMRWYLRFDRFRAMGSNRSVLRVYRLEREARRGVVHKGPLSLPEGWSKMAKQWRWRERAEAWDRAELERKRAEEAAERERERAQRIALIKLYGEKLVDAINAMRPQKMSAQEITAALKTIVEQLRVEYGEPIAKVESAGASTIEVVYVDRRNPDTEG